MAVCFKIASAKEISEFLKKEFQVILSPKVINAPTGELLEHILEKFIQRILDEPTVFKPSDVHQFNEFLDAPAIRYTNIYLISKCLFHGLGVVEFTIFDLKCPTPKVFRKLMTIIMNALKSLHIKDEIMEGVKKRLEESTTKWSELLKEKDLMAEELNSLMGKIFLFKTSINELKEGIFEKDDHIECLKLALEENDCLELRETVSRMKKERQDVEMRIASKNEKISLLKAQNAKIKEYISKNAAIQENIKSVHGIMGYKDNSSPPRKSISEEKYMNYYKVIMRAKDLHDTEKRQKEELKAMETNIKNVKDKLQHYGPLLQQLGADVKQLSESHADLKWKIDDLKKRGDSEMASLKNEDQLLIEKIGNFKGLELQKEEYIEEIALIRQSVIQYEKDMKELNNNLEKQKALMRAEMKREEDTALSLINSIKKMILEVM